MKTSREQYFDIERIIELDFVRATEAAALNTIPWLGRGKELDADAAACDAIRGMFDLMNICGEVVIGEGRSEYRGGITRGEHLGTWIPGAIRFDLAVDPIDGAGNIAKGASNAITCIAAASPDPGVKFSLRNIPSGYMSKLAYGPRVASAMERSGVKTLRLQNPIEENIEAVAKILHKRVGEVTVLVMDRPRHEQLIEAIRCVGASLRVVGDGDIAAAIAPSIADSGIDIYVGIGGSTEAVLASAALKCLGGDMQCMIWPRDEEEREELIERGYEGDLGQALHADDLTHGQNIIFAATGISDSAMLKGVQIRDHTAVTHSVLMRAKSRTIRQIVATHDLQKKTIHLRSDSREHRL